MPAKRDDQESRTTTKEAASEPGSPGSRERAGSTAWRPIVASRHPQFMVFTHGIAGLQPLASPEVLEQSLKNNPEIEVLDVLNPRNAFGIFGEGMPGSQRVVVTRMDEQKAALLARQAGTQLTIERDHPLNYGQKIGLLLSLAPGSRHQAAGFTANFKVLGNNTAVEGAEVSLLGSTSLSQGTTDRHGELKLEVTGESPDSIRALCVTPQADFWTLWISDPAINPSGENAIELTPLSATFHGFPKQQLVGWGYRAMKVDQLPPSYRGKGIKIGLIDSGVAAGHTALRGQIKSGYDAVMRNQQGWDHDVVGQGTHCAGIICGRSPAGGGIQGIAPEAEVIACKVSPGGSFSTLFEAIDFCIAQQVDLVHISVTGLEPSQIIEQKILQAKQLGIACIAAAGDSGGGVQYPASSPNVLAVSALGKQGEFPAQSYHAQTVTGFTAPTGFFIPGFSCFGPQVAVCAPGVAVVSSVPPDNFGAWDGTNVAAAHVTGLAALILAHHPDFQPLSQFNTRSAYRVERLFQVIQQSSQNVGVGAGLPDATWATMATPAPQEFTSLLARGQHRGFSLRMPGILQPFPGNVPFVPAPLPLRPDASAASSMQPESMANLLMTIQQLRAMMQSAGLL